MNAVILVLVCHSVLESIAVDVDRDSFIQQKYEEFLIFDDLKHKMSYPLVLCVFAGLHG